MIAESDSKPQELAVRKLSGGMCEFVLCENIIEKTDGERISFGYDLRMVSGKAFNYSESVPLLIRLKYSQSDEMDLINAGIADKNDSEYISYRLFVEKCKAFAKEQYQS